MIKMKYGQIHQNTNFAMAMQRLMSAQVAFKVAYDLKKMHNAFMSARKQIATKYQAEVIDAFSAKNEDGTIKLQDDGENFVIAEGKHMDDLKKSADAFWEREMEIERNPISMRHFLMVSFSALDLLALEPVLSELELAEEPQKEEKQA